MTTAKSDLAGAGTPAQVKIIRKLECTDDTDITHNFQQSGIAAWIVARLADRHGLTKPVARTVCQLARIGGAR